MLVKTKNQLHTLIFFFDDTVPLNKKDDVTLISERSAMHNGIDPLYIFCETLRGIAIFVL